MKMKNMLIGGMSLALVACISVGATLAYLTDTSDTVTNTFYGSDGISMTLTEAPVTPDPVTGGYVEASVSVQLPIHMTTFFPMSPMPKILR